MIDIKVGDPVVVSPSRYGCKEPVQAVVTKVARVWITVSEPLVVRHPREWRLRRDTQDSGDRNYPQHNSRFYTLPQWADHLEEERVRKILREHRIDIGPHSPLYQNEAFKAELADLVNKHLEVAQQDEKE